MFVSCFRTEKGLVYSASEENIRSKMLHYRWVLCVSNHTER